MDSIPSHGSGWCRVLIFFSVQPLWSLCLSGEKMQQAHHRATRLSHLLTTVSFSPAGELIRTPAYAIPRRCKIMAQFFAAYPSKSELFFLVVAVTSKG